jgi:hypothetical protein
MKRFYALLSDLRLNDENFATRTAVIILAFVNNTYFPGIIPEVVAFTDAAKDFTEALAKSFNGTKLSKAVRNAARDAANRALEDLVAYVNLNAKTLEALTSTALPISTNEVTISGDPVIHGVRFIYGPNTGDLEVVVKRSDAPGTLIEVCSDATITPQAVWIPSYQTSARAKFTNLPVGNAVWCRVTASGTRNRKAVSNPIQSKVIQ